MSQITAMKIIGIMLVFLSSAFFGFYMTKRYKMRIQILEEINELIISIKIIIEAESPTVDELFYSLASQKKLDNFFISKTAFLSSDYKKNITSECKGCSFLKEDDKRLFIGFINELGTANLEGQISIINGYIKQLENKIAKLLSEQNSKCRMYNSFGVLTGAFISIILS